jgi:hypothetical protein
MGRGKQRGARSALIPLSAEGAGPSRLPKTLVKSLAQEAKVAAKPQRSLAREAAKRQDLIAGLRALMDQSERQRTGVDFSYPPKSVRVMTGMLRPPEGMSDSKYRRQLTQLRQLGLVYTRNGAWWPLNPEAQQWLDEQAQANQL